MERTLLLMRHAKSSREDPMLRDFDRPLTEDGQNDALAIGRFIYNLIGSPDQIMSSEAVRAKETAECVAQNSRFRNVINLEPTLYNSSPQKYIKAISKAPEDIQSLLVVGHNPNMEQLVSLLCSGRPNEVLLRMSTASVACFRVEDRDWSTVEMGMCELACFVTPKMIKKILAD